MNRLIPQPSSTAEWWSLVVEAQLAAGYDFTEELESYLVMTLGRFISSQPLTDNILSIALLTSFDLPKHQARRQLRDVGDQCLLLSGLFPERAIKKNVSLSYFIDIGQQAYHTIATSHQDPTVDPALFCALRDHFVGLMDVLFTMRTLNPNEQN